MSHPIFGVLIDRECHRSANQVKMRQPIMNRAVEGNILVVGVQLKDRAREFRPMHD